MKLIRSISRNSAVCLALLIAAFVYGLVLPFCWGNNPAEPNGTLSLLCEEHLGWFWLWSALTGSAYLLNLEHLFEKYGCRNRFLDALALTSLLGMLLTAATLRHDITTVNLKRVLHWTGAISYAAALLLVVFVFFVMMAVRDKRFIPFAILPALTAAGLLFWLLVIGKSGYLEVLPLAFFEIVIGLLNFTPLVRPKEGPAARNV